MTDVVESWRLKERHGWIAVELDNGDVYAYYPAHDGPIPCTMTHRSFAQVLVDIDDIERNF
jgi:predicted solute-binding protein